MTLSEKPLWVGAVAYDPKVVTIWDIIRDYYRAQGVPIDYLLFSNYEAQIEALLTKRIDIAWNTNVAYVKVQHATGGTAKALLMRDTDIGFTSKIIARADKEIESLQDLKGCRFALGSADSGQAAILPYHYIQEAGLEPEKNMQIIRFDLDVGKHGDTGTSEYEVLRAVKEGKADAGAVGESTWIRMLETGQADSGRVRGIWTSPGYSHCNFTALGDFDPSAAQRFVETMLSMDPAQPHIKRMMEMEGLNRWAPAEEGLSGYDVLFEAMRQQGLLGGS
ncbi:MAG: PhnD/SsuA/transferrin family substrate-binding protein [Armatimonadetes bacterium]|nr:PhnD/SsuA/transferrin family substrate-binding protein [Armatimonadota bacterium]